MRIFIAIEIPDDVRAAINSLSKDLSGSGAPVKWVRPENIHLTLKFLDEVPNESLPRIHEISRTAAHGVRPIPITIEGVGVFPSVRRPRVMWIGISRSRELEKLHRRLEDGLAELGFEPEKRSWSPHLTIGRVKGSWNLEGLRARLTEAVLEPQNIIVDSFSIIKSDLRPEGPVYTVQKRISFH
jgi:2'-5' RNA ligase